MVVVFPACGETAKYNYMRTLQSINCFRLFLKDDFAENKRGNYLVEDTTERLVEDLIKKSCVRYGIKKLFFVGSSKGAYAAFNYAFLIPGVTVIAGAPQYFLGNYLNTEKEKPNLIDILGSPVTLSKIERLNLRLRNKVLTSSTIPDSIYLHYSTDEHTYNEHIIALLNDVRQRPIEVHEDIEHYTKHSDVMYYYPSYLLKTLKMLV